VTVAVAVIAVVVVIVVGVTRCVTDDFGIVTEVVTARIAYVVVDHLWLPLLMS
jgi:hypothetical protein